MIKVKIKLEGGVEPKKASKYAAAYDLYCPEDVELHTGRQIVNLKFRVELPVNYEAVVTSRSGFCAKGFEVARYSRYGDELILQDDKYRLDADVMTGTVDADYRGQVGVLLKVNRFIYPNEAIVLRKNTRLAQMKIREVPDTEFVVVEDLDMTNDRGGGFGHTGSK